MTQVTQAVIDGVNGVSRATRLMLERRYVLLSTLFYLDRFMDEAEPEKMLEKALDGKTLYRKSVYDNLMDMLLSVFIDLGKPGFSHEYPWEAIEKMNSDDYALQNTVNMSNSNSMQVGVRYSPTAAISFEKMVRLGEMKVVKNLAGDDVYVIVSPKGNVF